jgi:predicted nucleic acid-binding protein
MGMILDSCIWVALASGELENQAVIEAAGAANIYTSVISLGELSFGVESCSDPAERALRAACLRQIERRPTLPVSRHTAAAFGLLAAAVKQSGRSPRPRYNDLWIAAQAIEHSHALLTLNADDFAGLPGLQLVTLPFSGKAGQG